MTGKYQKLRPNIYGFKCYMGLIIYMRDILVIEISN